MKSINLSQKQFKSKLTILAKIGSLQASTFLYSTGVCGLRLKNSKGYLDVLPFQGQQVWKAVFHGRDLTMDSPVKEPVAGVDFLSTFGSYVVHCGPRRIGGCTPEDPHLLHGDLPNAGYQKASFISGSDKNGKFIGMCGEYEYVQFFGDHYIASPVLKLYENSSLFDITMTITNKNNTPMDLMYLAHINYRPVDNSRLVYSAKYTPECVRLRDTIPSHIKVSDEYLNALKELKANPSIHHNIKPGIAFNPEGVFYISYSADKNGFSHTMQIHPDGTADYVRHRMDELPKAIRWISRTKNHNSIAIIEPATSEVDGYLAEKKKGNVKILQGGETYSCTFTMGMVDAKEAVKLERFIKENFN